MNALDVAFNVRSCVSGQGQVAPGLCICMWIMFHYVLIIHNFSLCGYKRKRAERPRGTICFFPSTLFVSFVELISYCLYSLAWLKFSWMFSIFVWDECGWTAALTISFPGNFCCGMSVCLNMLSSLAGPQWMQKSTKTATANGTSTNYWACTQPLLSSSSCPPILYTCIKCSEEHGIIILHCYFSCQHMGWVWVHACVWVDTVYIYPTLLYYPFCVNNDNK